MDVILSISSCGGVDVFVRVSTAWRARGLGGTASTPPQLEAYNIRLWTLLGFFNAISCAINEPIEKPSISASVISSASSKPMVSFAN